MSINNRKPEFVVMVDAILLEFMKKPYHESDGLRSSAYKCEVHGEKPHNLYQ